MKETTNTNKEKKKKKKKKSGRSSTILLVVIIIAGLSLLLYPSVSNYWNSLHASRAIADYVSAVNNLDAEHYTELIRNARKYNEDLASSYFMAKFGLEQREAYNAQLNVIDTGIMGYIEIKKINCFCCSICNHNCFICPKTHIHKGRDGALGGFGIQHSVGNRKDRANHDDLLFFQ